MFNLISERDLYGANSIRPGLTGWAQINGRNNCGWDNKLEYDAYYVEHLSLLMDCKVMIKTIKTVLFADGVSVDSSSVEGNLCEERKNKIMK